MIHPGPRNSLTDIDGILVGQAADHGARTGTTVVFCDYPMTAAVDVRGGAPGSRGTDGLSPGRLVRQVDAIVLSGGSEFGLEAASAVTSVLSHQGCGLAVGARPVPVVPSAILFDMANGGDKDWGDRPPYHHLGRAALAAVGLDVALGNAGAGFGGKAGSLKAGIGTASTVDPRTGCTVAALVALNASGDATMPGGGRFWAQPFLMGDEAGPAQREPDGPIGDEGIGLGGPLAKVGANTTIGVVATDATLDQGDLLRLTIMAQDGLARALRPSHTPFDGDLLFGLSSGAKALAGPIAPAVSRLGALAADTVARAIARGVYHAEALGDLPSWRGRFGKP